MALSNYHCSISKENYPPQDRVNNNENYNNNNTASTDITITAMETPATTTHTINNSSHIPVTSMSNVVSLKKGVKRTSAAQRYDKSIQQTDKLVTISQNDNDIRKSYYAEKLKLYKMELALKERDVIAKENICTLLQQLIRKTIDD